MTFPDWLAGVHHDGSEKYVSRLHPRLGETVRLQLRLGSDAPVRAVYLRTFPDGEQLFTPMERGPSAPPCQWWHVDLPISQPMVHYRFLLQADDGLWNYTATGPTAHIPLDHTDFRILANYDAPEWLETAVFYQIFPDRFANGDPSNDPQPNEFEFRGFRCRTYPWGEPPNDEQPFPIIFYGGDLQGIAQHIDYLVDLGVNALYLNPIFTAYSNHKYDVIDYYNVDPNLGGNAALTALREALTVRDMRYILDIVPNHCGYWHPWFQDARDTPSAAEAEFFTFDNHPDDYVTWLGVWTLPKLNYRSAELRRRMYASDEAIFRHWLRPPYAADGWRVDVANMLGRQGPMQLGEEVARGIRHAVKSTNPAAYLLGENFFDATPHLQGDQWDAVMNYTGLSLPLWYWLSGYRERSHGMDHFITTPTSWPTDALIETWRTRRGVVPWAIALQQFNLLGSHDTARLRSVVAGNDALQRLAAIVQFTYPGVPCLYYGDEIGMEDEPDLESRGCMVWDESCWNKDLRAFYQALIALRKASPVLQRGGFQVLGVEPDTFAYQREGVNGRILVIAHRSQTPRPARPLSVTHGGIPNGTRFVEFFSGQELVVTDGALSLPEHEQGASLWQQV